VRLTSLYSCPRESVGCKGREQGAHYTGEHAVQPVEYFLWHAGHASCCDVDVGGEAPSRQRGADASAPWQAIHHGKQSRAPASSSNQELGTWKKKTCPYQRVSLIVYLKARGRTSMVQRIQLMPIPRPRQSKDRQLYRTTASHHKSRLSAGSTRSCSDQRLLAPAPKVD
jgi:hypothetical protein